MFMRLPSEICDFKLSFLTPRVLQASTPPKAQRSKSTPTNIQILVVICIKKHQSEDPLNAVFAQGEGGATHLGIFARSRADPSEG